MLFSCKTKTIVQTEYRDSLVYRTHYDSIFFQVKDSVFVREKNDTVLIEKWKTIFKDKTVLKCDTIYQTKTLTDIQIEKKQTGFAVFLRFSGVLLWVLVLGFILYKIARKW